MSRPIRADLWLCRRPIGKGLYPGSYPQGFVSRVLQRYGGLKPALHLCCGSAQLDGFVNVDFATKLEDRRDGRTWKTAAQVRGTMHQLPFADESFAFTLWDPPYGRYYSQRFYRQRHLRIHQAIVEVTRITKPGGHIAMLYQWPIQHVPEVLQTVALHAVTVGPQKRLRLLTVWQRAYI